MSAGAVVETERLVLRDWKDGDGDAFARHTNTPAVMRWLGGVLPPDKVAAAIARYSGWQAERGFTFWVVVRRSDAAWLGFCGLKLADAPNSPIAGALEIGWRLCEDAWGQGYAREAAAASLDFAFARTSEKRVVAVTVPGNCASRTLMDRLGMRREPTLDHEDPRFAPALGEAIVYAVTKDEWRARHG